MIQLFCNHLIVINIVSYESNQTFDDRVFDSTVDNAYLSFYFGPNPTVPKRTRVVLPIIPDSDFKRVPYQWDGRMIRQENNTVTMEVSKNIEFIKANVTSRSIELSLLL